MSHSTKPGAPQQPPLKQDAAEIERALRLLCPDGVFEVRAIQAIPPGGSRRVPTVNGFFEPKGWARAAEQVMRIRHAKGIYVTLNPVNPALLARRENRLDVAEKGDGTTDNDIVQRRWLLIDVDWHRPAGISSTDEQHHAAIGRAKEIRDSLMGEGWPEPVVADSGNGAHLLFAVDLPSDDGGLCRRCLEALVLRYPMEGKDGLKIDTTVASAGQISKLYGTVARKGDSTAERPHRLARLLRTSDKEVM